MKHDYMYKLFCIFSWHDKIFKSLKWIQLIWLFVLYEHTLTGFAYIAQKVYMQLHSIAAVLNISTIF